MRGMIWFFEPEWGRDNQLTLAGQKRLPIAFAILASLVLTLPWLMKPEPAAAENVTGELPYLRILSSLFRDLDASSSRPGEVQSASDSTRPLARPTGTKSRTTVTRASRSVSRSDVTLSSTLTVAALDALPPASGDAQWQCLVEGIYFESRGEPLLGQVAVAEVILNRVDSARYPNTICAVTNQGVKKGRRDCQFSYACDGRPETMTSPVARDRAEKLATLMLGDWPRTITSGALHFHATYVRPRWARSMTRTAKIGNHIFFVPQTRTASR